MNLSRRTFVKSFSSVPLSVGVNGVALLNLNSGTTPSLPDKASFPFAGTFLNAAYTHPFGTFARAAADAYIASRINNPSRRWPRDNDRDTAVRLFAELINADASDVAVVPSTMEGENLVSTAVGLDSSNGVVTDAFHYDASLAMYGEIHRRGAPVGVVRPRENKIELEDVEACIQKNTRLIAVSLVSSRTGFMHDLKALCKMAHDRGVMVYADIVQAAGAIPIDVKDSGVDFCCCGTYKWLMGDFGVAFLYVRKDRLDELHRSQFGWRQFSRMVEHVYPFDAPGPAIGNWKLDSSTISYFEVSTPDWAALAVAVASLSYIRKLDVASIQRYRQPLLDLFQRELPPRGFQSLTPESSGGPIASFAYKDAAIKLKPKLAKANVDINVYDNMIRISPSIYNDRRDVERAIDVLTS